MSKDLIEEILRSIGLEKLNDDHQEATKDDQKAANANDILNK